MRTLLLVAWLGPASPDAIGIVWHPEATADRQVHQQVRQAVVEATGLPASSVVDRAGLRAQRTIAHEVSRHTVESAVEAQARLETATGRFRDGDLVGALLDTRAVLATVRAEPTMPAATRLTIRAHLLRARIAWTNGDVTGTEASLVAAIVLDPEATISTRRVPPDFARVYERIREEIISRQQTWAEPTIQLLARGVVEIDGVAGLRPLPRGEHIVVVRMLGRPPAGVVASLPDPRPLVVEPTPVLLPDGLPQTRGEAETICDRVALERLLLVDKRAARWGLQSYRCGDGFSRPWFSDPSPMAEGVALALGERGVMRFEQTEPDLDLPWPEPVRPAIAQAPQSPATDTAEPARPWFKRAWVWVVVGAVVVGAVTVGVVVGTQDRTRQVVEIPGDFIER